MSCRTLGRRKCAEVSPKRVTLYSRATKSVGFVAEESLHPYVILPCIFGRRKCAEVLPKRVTLYTGNENGQKCCPSVPYFTLGRRKVWVSLPRSPIHPYVILPCTFRQRKWAEVPPESVVLHPRATKRRDSVAQACRAALLGDENGLKCRLKVSCRTLGRRKCSEVSSKRAALHPRATKSVGFVAEESHSSLRHSALHPRATKMDGSVA